MGIASELDHHYFRMILTLRSSSGFRQRLAPQFTIPCLLLCHKPDSVWIGNPEFGPRECPTHTIRTLPLGYNLKTTKLATWAGCKVGYKTAIQVCLFQLHACQDTYSQLLVYAALPRMCKILSARYDPLPTLWFLLCSPIISIQQFNLLGEFRLQGS